MSTKRLGRLQRAATIVPLALLSAAWTASVAGIGGVSAPSTASEPDGGRLPDGTSVPTEAIEAPASVSDPEDIEGVTDGNTQRIVATASTNAIPSAALAAYQRAETVINAADKSCNLTWQLIAAIGRVESNHGRFGGNVLDDDGVANPGIYGVALNGKKNTKAIRDTDAGQFDNDTVWDRAIGPMQFIPSTWSIVGVDADNDGARNPQDIDDAALATAVYLCSGKDDLSSVMGQRSAVYRYNNSQSYVDLVISIMNAYLEGEFTTVPNNTTAAGYLVPDTSYDYNPGNPSYNWPNGLNEDGEGPDLQGGADDGDGNGEGDEEVPPTEDPDTENPENPVNPPPLTGDDGPLDPGNDNVPDTGNPDLDDALENLIDGVLGPLSKAEALVQCVLKFPLDLAKQQACLKSYGL
ncbi:MAG TPA: lytic murein transglycosylase [Nocardioides sp.]|nr:lytic murein transglycosylase [Nocardioides sp.]